MSVITINRNSLLNSIIKEGKAVFGTVSNNVASSYAPAEPVIKADGDGAIVAGSIESYIQNGAPFIYAKGNGAVASGCVYESEIGSFIYADGNSTYASGYAYNSSISAIGTASHAEGYAESIKIGSSYRYFPIIANGVGAHAEGYGTKAIGVGAHAEGDNTEANKIGAHAEGFNTIASGTYSHAEGCGTTASSMYSHASGRYTIADLDSQFVCGKYNTSNNVGSLFVVGSGTNSYTTARKDAFVVSTNNIRGVVNGINDVIIGEPIGTMIMHMGMRNWETYNYPVEIDENIRLGIIQPKGYVLAKGGSIRLKYIGSTNKHTSLYYYRNNTDYVYIPRFKNDANTTKDVSYYDKFEIMGYRTSERSWTIDNDTSSLFPDGAQYDFDYGSTLPQQEHNIQPCFYDTMSEKHKKELSRFLNHIILYTKVYVLDIFSVPQHLHEKRPTLGNKCDYVIVEDSPTKANGSYLEENYWASGLPANATVTTMLKMSWYENTVKYKTNRLFIGNPLDDNIIIDLPDMSMRVPLGALYAEHDNFGNVSTMMPGGLYANLYGGATGGEEFATPGSGLLVLSSASGDNNVPNIETLHNNIPPYMAINFIIKYK